MNLYQIRYTDNEGSNLVGNFTERDEAAARKSFKVSCKGCALESIELIRENESATKQQERDALAAIVKMVEELGPQSYLKTAFAGCFADAEQNIEDDAAYSMKERYEMEKEKAEYFQGAASTFSNDLDAAREQVAVLECKVLSADDLGDCRALIREYIFQEETELAAAAGEIVKFADTPSSPEFAEAVRNHRNTSSSLEYYKALDGRVEKKIKAGA